MEYSDKQIIDAYIAGDSASFDLLVLRYLKLVYSVIFHYVKNQEDAEDLTQDVFVKVMRHITTFQTDKAFKPWILQIAKNQALDWLKKKKPILISEYETDEESDVLGNIPDAAPLADAIAMQNEAMVELREAMSRLPAEDQRVLTFRYIKNLSFKEIAEELHEVIDTVKSRHRRALLKLRKSLSESSFG